MLLRLKRFGSVFAMPVLSTKREKEGAGHVRVWTRMSTRLNVKFLLVLLKKAPWKAFFYFIFLQKRLHGYLF